MIVHGNPRYLCILFWRLRQQGLKRVKSYLRNTMAQERLNSLMVLHVRKELTDELDLKDVANKFVSQHESRLSLYGRF